MASAAATSRALLAFGILLAAGAPAHAQEKGVREIAEGTSTERSRCDSIPPVGWRVDTLFGSVSIEPARALPTWWNGILLDVIGRQLRLNPSVGGLPISGADDDGVAVPDTVKQVIAGQVFASLDRTGHLGSPQIGASSMSPDIDRSLLAAMRDAASAGSIPPFPDSVDADSVRVRFTVEEWHDSSSHALPLLVINNPTWILELPVTPMRGNPRPRYPKVAERARVEDGVLVSFVVDKEGSARLETARILKGRYREFQLAVLEILPQLRFHPARVDGCFVPQLVQMPFGFRIPR